MCDISIKVPGFNPSHLSDTYGPSSDGPVTITREDRSEETYLVLQGECGLAVRLDDLKRAIRALEDSRE